MTEEKMLELKNLIETQKDQIMDFFEWEESPISQQLDEIHKKFYEDSLSVIDTAITIAKHYKEHFNPSKTKKIKKTDPNPL
jgi:molybdopterin-biosynthesis enzyme MoeA-like protein